MPSELVRDTYKPFWYDRGWHSRKTSPPKVNRVGGLLVKILVLEVETQAPVKVEAEGSSDCAVIVSNRSVSLRNVLSEVPEARSKGSTSSSLGRSSLVARAWPTVFPCGHMQFVPFLRVRT